MPDADLFLAPATRFGYPAVATGCFVKAFSMLVAAGVPARQGYLNPFPVLVWAWFGSCSATKPNFSWDAVTAPLYCSSCPDEYGLPDD